MTTTGTRTGAITLLALAAGAALIGCKGCSRPGPGDTGVTAGEPSDGPTSSAPVKRSTGQDQA